MQGWRLPLASALALTLGLTPMGSVMAAPAAMPPSIAKAHAGSTVVEVRRRGHRHRHRHRGHGGLAIGLGIGVIGGLLAAEAYRNRGYAYDEVYDAPPASGDPRELCAQEFRSFEWDTGLYTTFAGEKKVCPYLR